MKITNVQQSRLSQIDPDNCPFGVNMSDHMLICEYENGKWGEPVIMPYGPMSYSPALMVIHYGQGIFEGMKAYRDDNDDIFLFRPERNFERFNKSAERMAMPEVPKDVFIDGLFALIDIDRDWVPRKKGSSLYIRPAMYASSEAISASISKKFTFVILTSPANSYYDKPLKIKIEDYYTRAADGGVGFTKCAGNYGASFYPTMLANKEGYDQVIWTDSKEHKYFEESGTMNVMVRIGDTLYTPPTSHTILSGITRDSLINIARHNNIEIREERILIDDVVKAYKEGTLKEVFGCGTAVVITRYSHVAYKELVMELPQLEDEKDSFAIFLKKQLVGLQTNELADPFGWRHKVEKK